MECQGFLDTQYDGVLVVRIFSMTELSLNSKGVRYTV